MNSRWKFLCSCFAACARATPQICLFLITNFASFSLLVYLFTYLFHNYGRFRLTKRNEYSISCVEKAMNY